MNRQKRFAMIIAIVMAALLLLPLLLGLIPSADAVTSAKLTQLKENAKMLKSEKTRYANQLASARSDRSKAIAEKEALDQQIGIIEQEIENTTLLIAEFTLEISRKQEELDAALTAEAEQMALFRMRVRAMEESSDISYLGILLGADSFSDLLGRMDMIAEIMEYDQTMMAQMRRVRDEIDEAKKSLENDKLEQQSVKKELADQQLELVAQYEEANQYILELQADEIAFAKAYAEAEKKEKEAQADMLKEQAALQALLAKQNKPTQWVGGTYTWPLPGYSTISSPFGSRKHPILKVNKVHTGVDLPAPTGTAIIAANAGTVITAKYSSGYGNYVAIDHGGGHVTLYGHMSKILVKNGQVVTKGETIGKVGSTGLSTGPHLHFEVIEGGVQKDPMKYFSKAG